MNDPKEIRGIKDLEARVERALQYADTRLLRLRLKKKGRELAETCKRIAAGEDEEEPQEENDE